MSDQDIALRLRSWTIDWNGQPMVRGEPPRDGLHCDDLIDAALEIENLRRQLVIAKQLMKDCCDAYPVASGFYIDRDGQDGYGPLRAMRVFLSDEQGEECCICQHHHRRGRCTEPTCPYRLTSAQRGQE